MEGMVVFSLKREDLKISYNLKKEFLPYLHVPMALSFWGEVHIIMALIDDIIYSNALILIL